MVWWVYAAMAVSALAGGAQAKQQAENAKIQLQAQAAQAEFQSKTAKLNAGAIAQNTVTEQQAYESQATIQAIQDGAAMASQRAAQGGSGVYMNSASKYESSASQKYIHTVNMANIETNRTNALAKSRSNLTSQMGNALVSKAQGQAASMIDASIDPWEAWGTAVLTVGAQAGMQYASMSGALSASSETPGGIGQSLGNKVSSGFNSVSAAGSSSSAAAQAASMFA